MITNGRGSSRKVLIWKQGICSAVKKVPGALRTIEGNFHSRRIDLYPSSTPRSTPGSGFGSLSEGYFPNRGPGTRAASKEQAVMPTTLPFDNRQPAPKARAAPLPLRSHANCAVKINHILGVGLGAKISYKNHSNKSHKKRE